jgi:hypothetical protein
MYVIVCKNVVEMENFIKKKPTKLEMHITQNGSGESLML